VTLRVKFNRAWLAAAFGALLTAGAGAFLHTFLIGRALINHSYDLQLVACGDRAAREAVMVHLDEVSSEHLQQPLNVPWDRALHARLIERLTDAGAKAIVFDIVFSDPSPTNPGADQQMARAMKASGRVILAMDVVQIGPDAKSGKRPIDLFLDNAAGIGSAEVLPDPDLVIRQLNTVDEALGVPSLAWATAEFVGAKATRREALPRAKLWMNYYGPPRFLPAVSYYEALDPLAVKDEFFRGKVVFVGAHLLTKAAGERKDEYVHPFSYWVSSKMIREGMGNFVPGVEVQATAFLNLFRGDWLERLSPWKERTMILALGLLFGFGLVRLRPVVATVAGLAGLGIVATGFQILFSQKLIWFPWLIVAGQIGLALFWSILFNSVQLYVQKRLYEHTLSLYLSPKLVKKFSRNPHLLKPGAEEQTITIFFSDIADFTAISQQLGSDALARLMNDYFQTAVSKCIHATDGTVVKYIGDAIFAFWNAPETQVDHPLRACEAALRFREHVVHRANDQLLRTRIGIHTGPARVGNFGSLDRVDYTALGEGVNLASRLEGLNKYLGTDCLISRQTKEGIGEQLLSRLLGLFQLKGFDRPVEVHELVGWAHQAEPTSPWRQSFAQALHNYTARNLEFAEAGFRQTLELRPDDGPSKFYLARLEELRSQALPEDWATHTVLREK